MPQVRPGLRVRSVPPAQPVPQGGESRLRSPLLQPGQELMAEHVEITAAARGPGDPGQPAGTNAAGQIEGCGEQEQKRAQAPEGDPQAMQGLGLTIGENLRQQILDPPVLLSDQTMGVITVADHGGTTRKSALP